MIKIFTALLLERSILVVSKDLENLTSCGLSFEYLIYPLEWFYTFLPIVPDHIKLDIFSSPIPFIFGVHTSRYEQIKSNEIELNCIVLLLDDRQIINRLKIDGNLMEDKLPSNVSDYLTKKLDFFKKSDPGDQSATGLAKKHHNLLDKGSLKPFLDSVLMIIDDYREYITYDQTGDTFKFDENIFFKNKNVYHDSNSSKYNSNENEFYHEFRTTQTFQEVKQ